MKYLVLGSNGPTGTTIEDMIEILEDLVLPGLEALINLESENTVLAGGVPVSERGVVFIIDARSNEELDQVLRGLPLWGILEWQVTPLQSFRLSEFGKRRHHCLLCHPKSRRTAAAPRPMTATPRSDGIRGTFAGHALGGAGRRALRSRPPRFL